MVFYRSSTETVDVLLGGQKYKVTRARLGGYLILQQVRKQGITALTVRQYLTEALGSLEVKGTGLELIRAFVAVVRLNEITEKNPLFSFVPAEQKDNPWDYPNRWAALWVHLISKTYGWSREEILNLDPSEAIAYLQEIAFDDQLRSEWEYSLSQNAFKYDPGTKTSKFEPLKRPVWMIVEVQPRKAVPIPKEWMPQGNVISMRSLLKKPSSSTD